MIRSKSFLALFFMKHTGDCRLLEDPAFSSATEIGVLKQAI